MEHNGNVVVNGDKLREYFLFCQKRQISLLFKSFLVILEDVRDKRYNINNETYESLRKRILDIGNDVLRETEENINKFNFTLK